MILTSVGLVVFGWFPLLKLPGAALLVFVLPGWTLMRSLNFDAGGLAQNAVLDITLSISLTLVVGLVLHFGDAITRNGWLLSLATLSLAGCAVAAWRRTGSTLTISNGVESSASAQPLFRSSTARYLLAALAIVLASIYVAAIDANSIKPFQFTELWVVASPGKSDGSVSIGLHNAESKAVTYRLEVLVDDRLARSWENISLPAGEIWQATYERTGLGKYPRVEVITYRTEEPDRVYRRAWLAAE